ncbi:MAG: 16S rRNA (guanine(966)-N(2))-methyltransferase RsmD [Alphaproteobacteria bacterium]
MAYDGSSMRITGGRLCGRRILVPRGGVRPTQDMVREAMFARLGGRVAGARFLDLFAGSGAVGLEAWSRGAELVRWVERDRRAAAVLERNLVTLVGDAGGVVRAEVGSFLARGAGGGAFDLVFADPPYARGTDGRVEWCGRLLDLLAPGGVLAAGGLFVMEQEAKTGVPPHPGWNLLVDRRYGRARLMVFRREE